MRNKWQLQNQTRTVWAKSGLPACGEFCDRYYYTFFFAFCQPLSGLFNYEIFVNTKRKSGRRLRSQTINNNKNSPLFRTDKNRFFG